MSGEGRDMSFQETEKRLTRRKPVSLEGTLISGGKYYSGYIENICEQGMHLITAPKTTKRSFIPETTHKLKIEAPSGKMTTLYCEVRWVHINKTPIHGLTYRMGMRILNEPREYSELITSLT